MIKPKLMRLAAAFCLCTAGAILAQTSVTTDPVGFTTTSCLASSDTYLGIPFTRPVEFSGTVASVSGNTVSVNGTPGWSGNQFVYNVPTQTKHYYLLVG